MNFFLDNKLVKQLASSEDPAKNAALVQSCATMAGINDNSFRFVLEWPSFLEYLGFGSIFENYPKDEKQEKIFSSVIEALQLDPDKEVIHYLYDQIFVECLTQIKKLPQVNPTILIDQIYAKRAQCLYPGIEDPFEPILYHYERKLTSTPYEAIHDLTLNLAWDRVCVYLIGVFDHTALHTRNGLQILKECLIESFIHIKLQGKTSPGFIRLVEALFAFHMKEENLENHTEKEWQVLCKGVETLQSREKFPDASYIDLGIGLEGQTEKKFHVFTLESLDKAEARLALANLMIEKIKREDPEWKFSLHPFEVTSLV